MLIFGEKVEIEHGCTGRQLLGECAGRLNPPVGPGIDRRTLFAVKSLGMTGDAEILMELVANAEIGIWKRVGEGNMGDQETGEQYAGLCKQKLDSGAVFQGACCLWIAIHLVSPVGSGLAATIRGWATKRGREFFDSKCQSFAPLGWAAR